MRQTDRLLPFSKILSRDPKSRIEIYLSVCHFVCLPLISDSLSFSFLYPVPLSVLLLFISLYFSVSVFKLFCPYLFLFIFWSISVFELLCPSVLIFCQLFTARQMQVARSLARQTDSKKLSVDNGEARELGRKAH